jgi:hypothetical protein
MEIPNFLINLRVQDGGLRRQVECLVVGERDKRFFLRHLKVHSVLKSGGDSVVVALMKKRFSELPH